MVLLRTQADLRACLERWDSFSSRLLFRVHRLLGCCAPDLPLFREEHVVQLVRAPNPADLNWEEAGGSRLNRWARVFATFLFMGFVMGVCVVLCYLLRNLQKELQEESLNEETGKVEINRSLGLSLLPAIGVSLLNIMLIFGSKSLSARERHLTKSKEMASAMVKLTLALTLNTGFVTLFLNRHERSWYEKGGLVHNMCFMLLIPGLVPPVMSLNDIPKYIRRARAARINPETTALTVKQYNALFEPSEPDVARRYAEALKIFLITTLYSPLLPWAPAFGVLCLVALFWADKYALLRLQKRPSVPLGPELASVALVMVRVFATFLLPFAVRLFLLPSQADGGSSVCKVMDIAVLVALLLLLLPRKVQRVLFCADCVLGSEEEEEFDADNEAGAADYYEAQHLWPAAWKYHKSHFLYGTLPDSVNPEMLSPEGGQVGGPAGRRQEDLVGAIQNSLVVAIEQVALIDDGGGADRPSMRQEESLSEILERTPLTVEMQDVKVVQPGNNGNARGGQNMVVQGAMLQ